MRIGNARRHEDIVTVERQRRRECLDQPLRLLDRSLRVVKIQLQIACDWNENRLSSNDDVPQGEQRPQRRDC